MGIYGDASTNQLLISIRANKYEVSVVKQIIIRWRLVETDESHFVHTIDDRLVLEVAHAQA